MPFIHDDFLLQSPSACRLYHEFASGQPIIDYHNHLPPKDLAENRQFANLHEIWLEGDHYKWRAMRAHGVDESLITGKADPKAKFLAWAETVPHTLRNPLYHWTHLELKRYFGIDELLSADNAESIWETTRSQLQTPTLGVHGILETFNIRALCTTDDPVDDLGYHRSVSKSGLKTKVLPAFRPDKALGVGNPTVFKAYVQRLGEVSGAEIGSLDDFLIALDARHEFFHQCGARISDHGLSRCPGIFASHAESEALFARVLAGETPPPEDEEAFAGFMMLFFGQLDTKRGWTKQLHLGAIRNTRNRAIRELGADTGFDSIGDYPQATSLAAYLDRLDEVRALPKMILYNNNPVDNYVFSTMVGNFQGGQAGKIQFGSGWWFLDAKEGIEWQLNALSNNGLLSHFVGMLTDSRSFMSFPRHEYFRRLLCNVLGGEMESGLIPSDFSLVGGLVKRICFSNAQEYLEL